MADRAPELSPSEKLRIGAVDKQARVELRTGLVAYWRESVHRGIDPGRPPAEEMTEFEKGVYRESPWHPPGWLQAFEAFSQKAFDARAEAFSSHFTGSAEYVNFLESSVLPEVLSLIEGPTGAWPDIMVEAKEAAGFLVDENSAQFVRICFQSPSDHVRRLLGVRIREWDARHSATLAAQAEAGELSAVGKNAPSKVRPLANRRQFGRVTVAAKRARTAFLAQIHAGKGVSMLNIQDRGGPTFKTIQKWASGYTGSRTPYVRGRIARALSLEISDVPK